LPNLANGARKVPLMLVLVRDIWLNLTHFNQLSVLFILLCNFECESATTAHVITNDGDSLPKLVLQHKVQPCKGHACKSA